MYSFIKRISSDLEASAPPVSILGLKIATVCLIFTIISFIVGLYFEVNFAVHLAKFSAVFGILGLFLAFVGKIQAHFDQKSKDSENSTDEELDRKPWEK